MLNQINKPLAIYLLSAIFKHFLHTFPKQALNNFCPQDLLQLKRTKRGHFLVRHFNVGPSSCLLRSRILAPTRGRPLRYLKGKS